MKDNGDFYEALAALRQAIALAPEYLSAWLNLGYCHLKKSEHVEAIHRRVGSPVAALDVLDGGCGTGAAGQQLRPFARRLTGVDLSNRMLSHARRTSAYDELSELELVQFLELHPQQFDLITIVDTFNYFGELISPLSAAARALKPAGLLFFTVELAKEALERGQGGFALDTTGRFVHSQAYIDHSLKDAGFVGIETSVIELRKERGEPVIGLLVSAQIANAIIRNPFQSDK